MKIYEDQCCDCANEAFPCRGNSCPLRNVPVHYCDVCDEKIDGDVFSDELYDVLCEDCLKELHKKYE